MRFEALDDAADLRPLEGPWEELRSGIPGPTDRLDWTLSYLETVGRKERPTVLCGFSGDRLDAVAPLVRPRGVLGGYEQIGVRYLGEPADLPVRDESALSALADELARRRLPVVLPRVPSESPTIPALIDAYGPRRVVVRRDSRRCPVLELEPGEAPERLLSKRMRSDLRRARRKADEFGQVTFEILAPSGREEFARAFEEAQAVELASWKGRERTAMAVDARERAFFDAYGPRASERGVLRIGFMRIDGDAVAMQFAIEDRGRYWLIKIGYDENYAKCSPGQLMMLHSIEYAAGAGLRGVEFLGSEAPWTRRWTKTEREMTALGVYPVGAMGAAALFGDVGSTVGTALLARGGAEASRARRRITEAVGRRRTAGPEGPSS